MKKFIYRLIFLLGIAGPTLGFLGRWHWLLDAFSHFRPQFTMVLLVTSILLIAGKQFKKGLLSITLFVYCSASLAPYFMPSKFIQMESSGTVLSIFYANVYTANQEHEKLVQLIEKSAPDVIVLLEINQLWHTFLESNLNKYEYKKAVPREDNFGIALYSRLPMSIETKYVGSAQVPSLQGALNLDGKDIVLWATHPLPPGSNSYWHYRNEQLTALSNEILKSDKPTLVVGDLNTSPWSYWFKVVAGKKLKDSSLGKGLQLTWPAMLPRFMRIAVDHILHTSEFRILDRQKLNDIHSDHFPLFAKVNLI